MIIDWVPDQCYKPLIGRASNWSNACFVHVQWRNGDKLGDIVSSAIHCCNNPFRMCFIDRNAYTDRNYCRMRPMDLISTDASSVRSIANDSWRDTTSSSCRLICIDQPNEEQLKYVQQQFYTSSHICRGTELNGTRLVSFGKSSTMIATT